tara:strand:- start:188 stop:484 length:297 start_codon:yes stop_codon:yes gene_type:complete
MQKINYPKFMETDIYYLGGQLIALGSLSIFLFLKGRNFWGIFALLGFIFGGIGGFPWLVLNFRLAHPKSFWARKFYSETKMKLAEERFENSNVPFSPK